MKKVAAWFLACCAGSTGLVNAGVTHPALPFPVAYAGARSPYEAGVDLARPERERIRAHLERVEADLRARTPAGLSEAQRAARAARLDDLHAYWTRGEFPLNRDFPDRLIPYFIDADGVPCAMGYLVIASGHAAFADEIRRNRNNAYIPEIAAADARLATWLEANGMTQEEAARVQPAYGPPSLQYAAWLHVDSLARVWAYGPDRNVVGGTALFRRDTLEWRLQSGPGSLVSRHCITASGLVAVVNGSVPSLTWKGKVYPVPPVSGTTLLSCAWDRGDKALWVGTRQGLLRYARQAPSDTLLPTTFSTSSASDTVLSVAATDSLVVAGTTRGIVNIPLIGGGMPVTWDSASLGGWRVTGLLDGGSGRRIWGGLNGQTLLEGGPVFSTRGLLRYDGTTWRRYRSTMSSVLLPGDTIQAIATRDDSSAWIATSTGFYVFSATANTPKAANLPSGARVFSLADDGAGGFYAGTSAGVYHYQNGTLTRLQQQPVVGLRALQAARSRLPAHRLERALKPLGPGNGGGAGAYTLAGRKARSDQAAGIRVRAPEVGARVETEAQDRQAR